MDTVRKRNISGEDLEVAVLDYGIVKAGAEADLPKYYPWHTKEDEAPILWPEATWADVETQSDQAAPVVDDDTEGE